MKLLVRSGLEKRFPQRCRNWKQDSNAIRNMSEPNSKKEIENVLRKLQTELPTLERSLFEAILDKVLRSYP